MFTKIISVLLSGVVLLSSCASSTMIQSIPSGAKIYIDEQPAGVTPYRHTDTKIVGSTTTVRLEKEGYTSFYTSFDRNEQVDVGAIIGGFLVLVPFAWSMKYNPSHTYELEPVSGDAIDIPFPVVAPKKEVPATSSKAERLRELNELFLDKIITQEEFDKEKKKILDED